MRRARLGGARAVLVARDQPGDDRLQRVGFGCGEGFERFELALQPGLPAPRAFVPRAPGVLSHGRARRERRPRNGCGAGGADLLEQSAARHIARRVVIRLVRHGCSPPEFFAAAAHARDFGMSGRRLGQSYTDCPCARKGARGTGDARQWLQRADNLGKMLRVPRPTRPNRNLPRMRRPRRGPGAPLTERRCYGTLVLAGIWRG